MLKIIVLIKKIIKSFNENVSEKSGWIPKILQQTIRHLP
jgi:hypothetical protein